MLRYQNKEYTNDELNRILEDYTNRHGAIGRPVPMMNPMNPEIAVETPKGTLVARVDGDVKYPGIHTDIFCRYNDGEMEDDVFLPLAVVEYGDGDEEDEQELAIAVFEDLLSDDCTEYLRFKYQDHISPSKEKGNRG